MVFGIRSFLSKIFSGKKNKSKPGQAVKQKTPLQSAEQPLRKKDLEGLSAEKQFHKIQEKIEAFVSRVDQAGIALKTGGTNFAIALTGLKNGKPVSEKIVDNAKTDGLTFTRIFVPAVAQLAQLMELKGFRDDLKIDISWAGYEDPKKPGYWMHPNFPIERYASDESCSPLVEIEQEFKNKSIKIKPNLQIKNDSVYSLHALYSKFKGSLLKTGDRLSNIIAGTGFNISHGSIGADSKLQTVNPELGHKEYKNRKEHEDVEGLERREGFLNQVETKTGTYEAYLAGGHVDHPRQGIKATFTHVMNVLLGGSEDLLQRVLTKLNISLEDARNSKSFQIFMAHAKKFKKSTRRSFVTNELLTKLAASGDKLATAISLFTADRLADVVVPLLRNDKLLNITGGFGRDLLKIKPVQELLEKRINSGKSEQNKTKITSIKLDMDGTIMMNQERLKASSPESLKEEPVSAAA